VIPYAHRRKTPGHGLAIISYATATPSGRAHRPKGASVIWAAIHSAVGWSVTLSEISRRRSWRSMTKTNSSRKLIVGTTRKSMAAMPAA
jgi:hypothetical protein